MSLTWEAVFCAGFTIYDFYEVVENFDPGDQMVVENNVVEDVQESVNNEGTELTIEIPCTPTSSYGKSPKRRTFGAQFAELKEEIAELKIEIEVKNTQIFAMLYELNKLLKK